MTCSFHRPIRVFWALLCGAALLSGLTSPAVAHTQHPPAYAQQESSSLALPIHVDSAQKPITDRKQLVREGVILRDYDPPQFNWLSGHRGIDFAAREGTAVLATAPGVVVFSQKVADKPVVVVLHADGSRSTFEPVKSQLAHGAPVTRGQVLGHTTLAPASHCSGECVHLGLRKDQEYLDPLRKLRTWTPIVLLPT